MNEVTKSRHQERVDAVIDIIKEITGDEQASEALRDKLTAMSYEQLGQLAMKISKTRSIDHI
ncbi:hypothetical protein [Paenibacillus beijingensis]|uniref:Uncharacterized protein n=1 Tax=Paenibacillus beijingensis TaxID=1126833 RepID=A0A0D5NJV5_9BACL|nr:hypothetical protein [Paenibacillus beijingensis]AJY75410.1 hypothetical protein VN24_13570 [Paenibacillus beijingensis]